MNPVQRESFACELNEAYARLRAEQAQKESPMVSLEEARKRGLKLF